MDNIINRIIEIDKNALDLKGKTERVTAENEERLQNKLEKIEEKELKVAREKGNEKYEKLKREGELESKKILHRSQEECEQLEKKYITIHKELEKEIFKQIFQG